MNRFVEFETEAVAAIGASVKEEGAEAVATILHELVENSPLLMAAARIGHPPIVEIESVVLRLLEDGSIGAQLSPAEVLEVITKGVTHVLSSEGFEPVRAEPVVFGMKRHPGQKLSYYRPSERSLFDAIDCKISGSFATAE